MKLNQKPSTCIKSGQNKYIPPSNKKKSVLKHPIQKCKDYWNLLQFLK